MSATIATLAARGLSFAIGPARLLDGVDIDLAGGELVGLIGPNGAGKTTLLRCLAGLVRPAGGTVALDDRRLERVPRRERGRRIGYLAQAGPVHWPLTVERVVALGRLPHLDPLRQPGPADAAAIDHALQRCDVHHLRDRTVTGLSGGERARVLLARALAARPALLLADEPVAGLDPAHQLRVMEVLRAEADGANATTNATANATGAGGAGMGILCVLHDLTLAARYCHRLVLMDRGRVVMQGPPAKLVADPRLDGVYGVRFHRLPLGTTMALLPDSPSAADAPA